MIYRGWRILALVSMPRAFQIKNMSDKGVEYGAEIGFKPALRPSRYQPYKYVAEKDGAQLDSTSVSGLKKLIDAEYNR